MRCLGCLSEVFGGLKERLCRDLFWNWKMRFEISCGLDQHYVISY
jgi:hypothetical protein